MNRTEVSELLVHGENSGLVFERDDVGPERLAGEMAALLNLEGGRILLGVEDDATVTGLTRESAASEEWVEQLARARVQPAAMPYWQTVGWDDGRVIGVISLPANAPDRPYRARRGDAWVTRLRVGTTTRDASREEEQRVGRQSRMSPYGLKPVLGTHLDGLDVRRVRDYFVRVRGEDDPPVEDAWQYERLLCTLGLATESVGYTPATVDGMLLFGDAPGRFLPQSGMRAICRLGPDPDSPTRADEEIKGPLVPLGSPEGTIIEPGIVDRAWDFVRRNTAPSVLGKGAPRIDRWAYPEEAVREAVLNALVHRDYGIADADILLAIYSNRMEITSPGRLPGAITPDKMRVGTRYARNQTLVNVMRDYADADVPGGGVRTRIIRPMRAHNGTEPDLVEEEHRFTVRLRGEPESS